ncbi:MAG: hypothetical protein V5A62_04030 [Haloarculaceae archaeon]
MEVVFHAATMVSTNGAVGADALCSPLGCVSAELLAQALLYAGLGALTVFALATLAFIPDARAVLRREHERAGDERDAFARFGRRVADLDATPAGGNPSGEAGTNGAPGFGVGALALSGTAGSPPDDRVAQARRAYRDTVMSVPHYEEEYGESLTENVSAEFGESVAIALDGADAFTPGLRHTLVDGAETARDRRNSLVRAIEQEETALRTAASTLSDVESEVESVDGGSTLSFSFEQLMDRWGRLYDLERECETVLEERQETLQSGYGVPLRLDGPITLQEYLYDSLPVTYPILSEATRLIESVREVQDATSVALSRRV